MNKNKWLYTEKEQPKVFDDQSIAMIFELILKERSQKEPRSQDSTQQHDFH